MNKYSHDTGPNREAQTELIKQHLNSYRERLTVTNQDGNNVSGTIHKIEGNTVTLFDASTAEQHTVNVDTVIDQNFDVLQNFAESQHSETNEVKNKFPENAWHTYHDGRPCKVKYKKDGTVVILVYANKGDKRTADIYQIFLDGVEAQLKDPEEERRKAEDRAEEERRRKRQREEARRRKIETGIGIDTIQAFNTLGIDIATFIALTLGDKSKRLKEKYRAAAKIHHPDLPTGNTEKMQAIDAAHRLIKKEFGIT